MHCGAVSAVECKLEEEVSIYSALKASKDSRPPVTRLAVLVGSHGEGGKSQVHSLLW